MVHLAAKYKFVDTKYPNKEFTGFGYDSTEYSSLKCVTIEFVEDEVLAEVSSTGVKITDFLFLIG